MAQLVWSIDTYPLDSGSSSGKRYSRFEQPGLIVFAMHGSKVWILFPGAPNDCLSVFVNYLFVVANIAQNFLLVEDS